MTQRPGMRNICNCILVLYIVINQSFVAYTSNNE